MIQSVMRELRYLETSNDIHSPSHNTSIVSLFDSMEADDTITLEQSARLEDALVELWCVIAELDECKTRANAIKSFRP